MLKSVTERKENTSFPFNPNKGSGIARALLSWGDRINKKGLFEQPKGESL